MKAGAGLDEVLHLQHSIRRQKMGKFLSKVGNIVKWMFIVLLAGSILLVLMFRYIPVYTSPLMFIRAYEQVSRGEKIRWHHSWVPLEEMSADLPLAVMSCEDQNFLIHNGFDWEAIQKVINEREEGKRFRGGSTISQQTAKYLNTIEMGDGIYGAEAVAQEHFGCHAKDLTRNQCAMIAITLPNPIKFNSASPTNYMYRRQSWCIRQMKWLGRFPMREEEEKEK